MTNPEENNRDRLEDTLLILESALKSAQEQKEYLQKYCEEIAAIMDQLKTESAKQELAEITQVNYKKMLEFDINIAKTERMIGLLKIQGMFMF